MSKKSRDKGARGELEVAELLRPVYPSARRRCSGEETQDAVRGRDIAGTPGICVQVQVTGHSLTPWTKLQEAVQAAGPDEIPVAVMRKTSPNGRGSTGWMVVMRPGDFLALMLLSREAGALP